MNEIILKTWDLDFKDDLIKHANNPKIAANLTDAFPYPYQENDAVNFINKLKNTSPTSVFAIVLNDEAIGSIGLHPQQDIMRKNMELGYFLGEEHWGKGIITKAIKEIVNYGFNTFDIERIFARPFGYNLASQKALEKAGFVLEARLIKTIFKNGEYCDELIYAIRKSTNVL